MTNIVILDNRGETHDRYTIIDRASGEMWGASANPYHPKGYGQHCGTVRNVEAWLQDCDHVGQRVDFDTLPRPVQQYIQQVTNIPDFITF